MNTIKQVLVFSLLFLSSSSLALAAMDHSGHGGKGRSISNGKECNKLKVNKNKLVPPPLSAVAPESDFSFLAFNVDKPENLEITVKKIPVKVSAEAKGHFLLVRGQLPAGLKNTHARINVKVRGSSYQCSGEEGWLVKISD